QVAHPTVVDGHVQLKFAGCLAVFHRPTQDADGMIAGCCWEHIPLNKGFKKGSQGLRYGACGILVPDFLFYEKDVVATRHTCRHGSSPGSVGQVSLAELGDQGMVTGVTLGLIFAAEHFEGAFLHAWVPSGHDARPRQRCLNANDSKSRWDGGDSLGPKHLV